MNEDTAHFFQNQSLRFLEMAFRADKHEVLKNPDGYGRRERECGDAIEIFLVVRDDRIVSASFGTSGCIYSFACANAVVHIAEGKSIEEAAGITPDDVIGYLETLPRAENHCALLAVQALLLALANVRETQRHPWRKLFRV
jgi:nitrogen fixation NifU-like protein